MLQYRVFEPDDEPEYTAVMAPVLGGTQEDTGPLPGDHSYRGERAAKILNMRVIIYDRSADEADNPAAAAAEIGYSLAAEIDRYRPTQVVLAGASAGALSVLGVVRSQTLRTDCVTVFDPVGVKEVTVADGLREWFQYQYHVEGNKPDADKNQHPIPNQTPWSQLAAAKWILRTGYDISHNAKLWKHALALEHLTELAIDPSYQDIAVRAEFVGHTFTATHDETLANFEILCGLQRESIMAAPYELVYSGTKYHSWTDDPERFAEIISKGASLTA